MLLLSIVETEISIHQSVQTSKNVNTVKKDSEEYGGKWSKCVEITEYPKIVLPTLVTFWIIMLFRLHQTWMDKSKFFGIVGAAIGGGIMAPIIWLYRLKKK